MAAGAVLLGPDGSFEAKAAASPVCLLVSYLVFSKFSP
jgi:hypothetical protein